MKPFYIWAVTLFVLLSKFAPHANAQQFGAWSVGPMSDNEGVYAATLNDSNGVLGQYCYKDDGNCLWILANTINCDEKSQYPILVNSDAGATNMQLLCVKVSGKPRYAFMNFSDIDGLIKQSSYIGFAFPMASGQFQVSRFKLNGANKAISYMRDIAEKIVSPSSSNTKDKRL